MRCAIQYVVFGFSIPTKIWTHRTVDNIEVCIPDDSKAVTHMFLCSIVNRKIWDMLTTMAYCPLRYDVWFRAETFKSPRSPSAYLSVADHP